MGLALGPRRGGLGGVSRASVIRRQALWQRAERLAQMRPWVDQLMEFSRLFFRLALACAARRVLGAKRARSTEKPSRKGDWGAEFRGRKQWTGPEPMLLLSQVIGAP
jgi:hypothetical protein